MIELARRTLQSYLLSCFKSRPKPVGILISHLQILVVSYLDASNMNGKDSQRLIPDYSRLMLVSILHTVGLDVYFFISEMKPFSRDPAKQARYEAHLAGKGVCVRV